MELLVLLDLKALRHYLQQLQDIGINHVALNLRFQHADVEQTLHRLAEALFPEFTNEEI